MHNIIDSRDEKLIEHIKLLSEGSQRCAKSYNLGLMHILS